MIPGLEDTNVRGVEPLVSPRAIKARLPSDRALADHILRFRQEIRDILHGRDRHRLLVVVGPCSIHDPNAALDYARRLREVAEAAREHLLILMRTYFEKPRTAVGWKGLLNDPRLDGSCDVRAGLFAARRVLLDVGRLGLPCATEFLDPITPAFLADLVSWASVGARTIESQTHREMASGLSMPVGLKNPTDGNLTVVRHALIAAAHPHSFLGVGPDGATSVIHTTGNRDCHLVLRGGAGGPNHGAEHIDRAIELIRDVAPPRPVMVDCSHDNSGKNHERQGAVCRDVLGAVAEGREAICGVMLESHLEPGRQKWEPGLPLAYGVSITDACIGWAETRELLAEIEACVAAQRPAAARAGAAG